MPEKLKEDLLFVGSLILCNMVVVFLLISFVSKGKQINDMKMFMVYKGVAEYSLDSDGHKIFKLKEFAR